MRDKAKGEKARHEILAQAPSASKVDVQVWLVDLESYASVLEFSERIHTALARLDGFIANAALEANSFDRAEGLEKTLTINVVSTYLMTLRVLLKMKETAKKFKTDPVLSIVGSMMHVFAPDAQLDPPSVASKTNFLSDLSDKERADMGSRYPLSKLIVHLCFEELIRSINGTESDSKASGKVVVNLVNPGWCRTELDRHKGKPLGERLMAPIFIRTGEVGSRTLVHAVTAGRETHGKYLSECKVKPQSTYMRGQKARQDQQRLWRDLLETLEKSKPGVSEGIVL